MQDVRFALLSLAVVFSVAGGALPALAQPTESSSPDPVLPDPPSRPRVYYPPGEATADVADPGQAFTKAEIAGNKCAPQNPCAVPSPALDHAALPAKVGHVRAKTHSAIG